MTRFPESRFLRRLRQREALRRQEELRHPLGDPRLGDDRRQQERRHYTDDPAEIERRMREAGIARDRRSGYDRRTGTDRRR